MNIDSAIAEASRRITDQVINPGFDRLHIHNRIEWKYAQRSMSQRLRNDHREQRRIQAAHEWANSTGAPK